MKYKHVIISIVKNTNYFKVLYFFLSHFPLRWHEKKLIMTNLV